MAEGWICPSCKRGIAPDVKTCDHGGVAALKPPFVDTTGQPMDLSRLARSSRAQALQEGFKNPFIDAVSKTYVVLSPESPYRLINGTRH